MIFDLHNDLLTARLPLREKVKTLYAYPACVSVVLAIWTTRLHDPQRAALRLAAPVKGLKTDCRLRFSVEDLGFTVLHGTDLLRRLPLLYAGLTWNFDNELAGGASGQGTLTDRGSRLISAMNEAGIAVDTAHLNDRSFEAVVDRAARPFDSHCACRALNGHRRNLTDAQLRIIAARKGIVGITAAVELGVTRFIDFVDNIDHAVETAGIDCVAVGTDLFGATMPENLTTYSHFDYVENALFKRGYTKRDVDKILFTNAQRFFAATPDR